MVTTPGSVKHSTQGHVLRIEISNPTQRNALTPEMLDAITTSIDGAASDSQIRVIILRGEGENFSSGYSLSSFPSPDKLAEDDELTRAAMALESSPVPSIAVLNGDAIGAAFHLALAADFRIAAPHARVGITPARFGIIYPWQGIRRSIDVAGLAVTRRLFLTAKLFEAEAALGLGLLDDVSDSQRSLDDVEGEWSDTLAKVAPLSVAGTKTILGILARGGKPAAAERDEILRLRRAALASNDAREALGAFQERRPAVFTGR